MRSISRELLLWGTGILLLSGLLVIVDRQETSLTGWLAYLVVCVLCAVLISLVWRWLVAGDSARSLRGIFAVALSLRLVIGVGLFAALPVLGYDEKPQRAGYIYFDAYNRDIDSFQLARSQDSLITAFTEPSEKDQYGGLKFLSALVYRALTPEVRRPLLIVLLAATVSSLAVILTWSFVSLTFGRSAAVFSAWIMALFPDAVLLGASQMREPFMIFALAMALYGYALARSGGLKYGLAVTLLGALLVLPISPPYAVGVLAILALIWLWEGRASILRAKWLLMAFLVVSAAALIFVIRAWSTTGNLEGTGLAVVVNWWKSLGSSWLLNEIWTQSDWTRHLMRSTPEWAHFPVIVLYGVFRPFLPAGVVDSGAPIWRGIAIWRGLGWFALLPFLLYAPLAAIRRGKLRSLPVILSVLVWILILIASLRGAGDQWDNPRYRAAFICLQSALAGWAWVHARENASPWLRRFMVLVALVTVLFTTWYAFRARLLPTFTPLHAMATVAGSALLLLVYYFGVDWLRGRRART